jgi:hypothetical protein
MPDIFQKVKNAESINNGKVNIYVNVLTSPTGINPQITQDYVIANQSGILDPRWASGSRSYYTA